MTKSFWKSIELRSEEVVRFCIIAAICTFLSITTYLFFFNPYYTFLVWILFFIGFLDANFCFDNNQRQTIEVLSRRLKQLNLFLDSTNVKIKISKVTGRVSVNGLSSDNIHSVNSLLTKELQPFGLIGTNFTPTKNPTRYYLELYWKSNKSVIFLNK